MYNNCPVIVLQKYPSGVHNGDVPMTKLMVVDWWPLLVVAWQGPLLLTINRTSIDVFNNNIYY